MKRRDFFKTAGIAAIQIAFLCLVATGLCTCKCMGQPKMEIQASAEKVGRYEKLELSINVCARYDNPFDPNEVDLMVLLKTPSDTHIALPAFYCQDYERRKLNQGRNRANWYYPVGEGTWKARFAPMEMGIYLARARLKDQNGTAESESIRFECIPSPRKGFLRIGRQDPRLLEFTEGAPFFAIGQNLAFVGEGQYVDLTKAEEIFEKLSRNGANFVRIWTCCKDWAMAIEAQKSAWTRSWLQKNPIVSRPGSEDDRKPRKCVKLEGSDGATITVSPSHLVALRPQRRYVLTGQFKVKGPSGLRLRVGPNDWELSMGAAENDGWKTFKREFITGANEFWLGRMVFSLVGSGIAWLDKLSLKEVGGGAELLWEADVNRPIRGFYNQLDCFMLDQLVQAAEQNDIYLMLCVITRDLYMKSLSDEQSPEYQQAIEDAKKFMRYVVARWGYSTNVAAWEYFNEINPALPTDRFYDEVGRYLEQIDIYRHLRTTSTWHPSAKDCHHPRLDIGQLHHYMRPGTKQEFKNEMEVLVNKTRFLRQHAPSKPVLIGEFGLATPKWGLSEYMKQDTEGVHFHNSLWASAFAGASGTALFWWWDQLDRQDAYSHYRPLAEFLKDISLVGLRPIKATASDKQLRLLGYQGNDCAYLWLFNPQTTWWNLVIQKQELTEIKATTLEIQGLHPGRYRVEWWDTYEGKTVEKKRISPMAGPLRIIVPPFSRDIACKISRPAEPAGRMQNIDRHNAAKLETVSLVR